MKYWFYDFLDEITENLSKMWVESRKKKNPDYKENPNLKNRIRFSIRAILIAALAFAIIYFVLQVSANL